MTNDYIPGVCLYSVVFIVMLECTYKKFTVGE
jgi:hypothetical protein